MPTVCGETREVAHAGDVGIGLCGSCEHCRAVPGGRSTFFLCGRALTDPAYRKYPVLPVFRCPGYDPRTHWAPPAAADDKLTE